MVVHHRAQGPTPHCAYMAAICNLKVQILGHSRLVRAKQSQRKNQHNCATAVFSCYAHRVVPLMMRAYVETQY